MITLTASYVNMAWFFKGCWATIRTNSDECSVHTKGYAEHVSQLGLLKRNKEVIRAEMKPSIRHIDEWNSPTGAQAGTAVGTTIKVRSCLSHVGYGLEGVHYSLIIWLELYFVFPQKIERSGRISKECLHTVLSLCENKESISQTPTRRAVLSVEWFLVT